MNGLFMCNYCILNKKMCLTHVPVGTFSKICDFNHFTAISK